MRTWSVVVNTWDTRRFKLTADFLPVGAYPAIEAETREEAEEAAKNLYRLDYPAIVDAELTAFSIGAYPHRQKD